MTSAQPPMNPAAECKKRADTLLHHTADTAAPSMTVTHARPTQDAVLLDIHIIFSMLIIPQQHDHVPAMLHAVAPHTPTVRGSGSHENGSALQVVAVQE